MQKALQKIFQAWGSELIWKRTDQHTAFRGFLQHSASKSWQNMRKEYAPLGEIPGGQYTLIAPPEIGIAVGDTIQQGEICYEVRRAETVMYGNEALYIWGLCAEKGGEDTWAMQS